MLTGFENKVADFIKVNALFNSSGRVLLAVSGGADSTALLYTMCALKAGNILSAELICAHINHRLRGVEADLDEDFVIAEAAKLNLAVITKRVDVREFARRNKLSIETAARKLRLESLIDIAKANSCDCVATAHQKNDNAETILQRLSRGTGFRGLGGIWPKHVFDNNISFVRPLLCVGRDEVTEYLKKKNLKWRDDHTNVDCSYRRNFIRHRLLPALQQECSGYQILTAESAENAEKKLKSKFSAGSALSAVKKPLIVEQLFDLSVSAQRFNNLVCSEAEKVWPKIAEVGSKTVLLNLKSFLAQPQMVKVELVRRSLTCLGSGERDLTHRHYKKILQLTEQACPERIYTEWNRSSRRAVGGKKIELPNGFVAYREYNNLIFDRPKESSTADESVGKTIELKIPGKTKFGCYLIRATILDAGLGKGLTAESTEDAEKKIKFKKNSAISAGSAVKGFFVEQFDLDKVKLPLLVVRPRRAGDKFWPLGLAGEKKVGKFLTAAKVPQQIRKKVLIVADSEKIIWLWPIRISEQVKITSETKKFLQLKITESDTVQEAAQK